MIEVALLTPRTRNTDSCSATARRCFLIGLATIIASLPLLPPAQAALDPEQAEQLRQAQAHYEQERYGDAVEVLEGLLDDRPDLAEAHRLLGHVHHAQQRPEAARASLTAALRYGAMAEDVLGRLVEIDLDAGHHGAALASAQWLTILRPDDRSYRLLRAGLLERTGATAEAAATYREHLDAHPADAEAWARLARLHIEAEDPAAAAVVLEQAHRLGLRQAPIARTLAAIWANQGDLPQTLHWHELAMAMESEPTAEAHLRRAELLLALDDLDRAAAAVDDALAVADIDSDRARALSLRGWIAEAAGDDAAAVEAFAEALGHGLAETQILRFVATHWFNAGRYADAADLIEQHTGSGRGRSLQQLLITSLLRSDAGEGDRTRTAIRQYVARHGADDDARRWIRQLAAAGP